MAPTRMNSHPAPATSTIRICWRWASIKNRPLYVGLCATVALSCRQIYQHGTIDNLYVMEKGQIDLEVATPESLRPAAAKDGEGFANRNGGVCARLEAALDLRTWAPVRYHKDRTNETTNRYQAIYFNSIEEDDATARATIAEFNAIQRSDRPVLTPSLLDAGITMGAEYPALRFAERVASIDNGSGSAPLQIVVFGNSFASGSNCGESSVQFEGDCAWPGRLAQRWTELLSSNSTKDGTASRVGVGVDVSVDWHMWQENAQGSINIAQKLSLLMESFSSRNVTPDAILLDNSMSDHLSDVPWFEAVVRVLVKAYPGAVIVSIVDAGRNFATKRRDNRISYQWLRSVQQHYGLTTVDIPEMVRVLYNETNATATTPHLDRLWPQALNMVTKDGQKKNDKESIGEVYWDNFVPRVRKTKVAHYPANHPPWPTHQYVADTIAHALLRTASHGCSSPGTTRGQHLAPPPLLKDTVAPKEKLDACPICLDSLSRIDAKDPPAPSPGGSGVVEVVCGDWKWVTDERNRAGWQSDVVGSLIRFRLRIGAVLPMIAVTYMGSYTNFGDFLVTFRTEDGGRPLVNCGDISNNVTTLPSLKLMGNLPRYSLSKVVIFPAKSDVLNIRAWELLNATVLSRKKEIRGKINGTVADYEYVDLYVENIKSHFPRVKIQKITTC